MSWRKEHGAFEAESLRMGPSLPQPFDTVYAALELEGEYFGAHDGIHFLNLRALDGAGGRPGRSRKGWR